MDRLIELLNLFIEENKSHDYTVVDHDGKMTGFNVMLDGKVEFLGDETILCLHFGFIDWLWEKGYIDKEKCLKDEDFRFLSKHYEVQDASYMVLATRYSNIDLLINRLKDGNDGDSLGQDA